MSSNKYYSVIQNKTIQFQESHLNHKSFSVKSYEPVTATTTTSLGTGTWTAPQGTVSATFYVWGAGGGGSGFYRSEDTNQFRGGHGGGGGGFGILTHTGNLSGRVYTIAVGSGGVRGQGNVRLNEASAQGGNGGNSSVVYAINDGANGNGGLGGRITQVGYS